MSRHDLGDLLVRPLDEGDPLDVAAAANVHLGARADAVARGSMPAAVHPDDEVRRWFAREVVQTREVWVAEADRGLRGVLVLDDAFLDQLSVAPARQRRGIGSALLQLAASLRPAGFDLWVFEQNVPAIALYERHGLVLQERTAGEGNEERAPDRRYRWPGGGSGGASVGPGVHARLA